MRCPGSSADQISTQTSTLRALGKVGEASEKFRQHLSKVEEISWASAIPEGVDELMAQLKSIGLSRPLKSLSLLVQEPVNLQNFWMQREGGLGVAANFHKLEHLALFLGTPSASSSVLSMLTVCTGLKSLSIECTWVVREKSPLVSDYLQDVAWVELLRETRGLEHLRMAGCCIETLPSLPKLTRLDLSQCEVLERLPELPELTHLELRTCHGWQLREDVAALKSGTKRQHFSIDNCAWQVTFKVSTICIIDGRSSGDCNAT